MATLTEEWAAATRAAGRCCVPGCTARADRWRSAEDRLEGHHVVPRQRIRRVAAAERWSEGQLQAVLWDVANHVAVCGRHHNRHERALERLPREVIREETRAFAESLGLAHLLDTLYARAVIPA